MKRRKLIHPMHGERTAGLKHATIKDILFAILFCTISIGIFKHVEAPKSPIISPVQAEVGVIPSATPTPTRAITPTPKSEVKLNVTPERQEIADYIREVFGKHADKAFLVLSCENNSLNPDAVNTAGNVPQGSRDIGVFQINEYWQGVNGKFLFNWKINVLAAYQIFEDNGQSFERWTCGRKYGV